MMKKIIVVSLALMVMLLPNAFSQEHCDNSDKLDYMKIAKLVTGVTCFENKNLKKDYKEVCGCVKRYPLLVPNKDVNKNLFAKKAKEIIQSNGVVAMFNYKDIVKLGSSIKDKDSETKEVFREIAEKVIYKTDDDETPKQKEDRRKEREKEKVRLEECGYPVDEFRRMSRIPDINLIKTAYRDETSDGEQDNILWSEYLEKNPNLKAIDENLSPERREAFRTQVINRMQDISEKAADGSGLWNKTVLEGDTITRKNDTPDKNLWLQIDEDFREGELKNLINSFYNESRSNHEKLIEQAHSILGVKKGFDPNFKFILENDSLWDVYFSQKSNTNQTCGLQNVTNKQTGQAAFNCLLNVSAFCSLYDSAPKEPKLSEVDKIKNWDFKPLVNIEKSYKTTKDEYDFQVKLVCDTKMKISHLVDKNGKEVNAVLNIEEFKKSLCKQKSIFIGPTLKPTISDSEISAACDSPDYARLQGFYQRLIKKDDFLEASELQEGQYVKFRIDRMRKFLQEKSKFDLPTENIEGSIVAAISSGDPKTAVRSYSERIAQDRQYIENIRSHNQPLTEPVSNFATVPKVSTPTQVTTPIAPTENIQQPVVSGGFSASGNVNNSEIESQKQIMQEESKRIVDTKEKIAQAESAKAELPPSSPDNSAFEKQIQELKDQLAQSQARFQTASEALKKINVANQSTDEKVVPTQSSQRNISSAPSNLNTDTNTASTTTSGKAGNNNTTSVSGAGKLSSSDGSSKASNNNKALLQANNADAISTNGKDGLKSGLTIQIVKDGKDNSSIGIVSDRSAFELLKKKDKDLYARYMEEMISKKINTLIVRDGENVLRYKLVEGEDGFQLQEESGVLSANEQKYFKKDLTNLLNSTVQTVQ